MATRCGLYPIRYNGMPIVLRDESRRLVAEKFCGKDSPEETQAIIEKGIGKGCSMEVINAVE